MDLLTTKLDFNTIFDRSLMKYRTVINEALVKVPPDFDMAQAAKEAFRDILFVFFTQRMIEEKNNALPKPNNQKDNPST